MNRGGIFLDRDGTINREVDFLTSPDELQLLPGSAAAIHLANALGFKVFIVTNQSGVARGLLSEDQLQLVHERLLGMLSAGNAHVDAIYYCPHHPDVGVGVYKTDCACRKPNSGMIDTAVAAFPIRLAESFVIGDRMIDIQLGNRIGVPAILVTTGYGNEELALCRSHNAHMEYVANDLLDAMHFVERRLSGSHNN